jgi:ribosomal protein S18 acetylase RimI-like enzyme
LQETQAVIPRSLDRTRRGADVPLLGRLLAPFGVVSRWRAAMGIVLDRLGEQPSFPEGYQTVTWRSGEGQTLSTAEPGQTSPGRGWLDQVGEIDQRSYAGTIDAVLYGHYFRTAAGSRRLWQEAMAGRFGRFDPERTLILLRDGQPCGHLMACLRSAREGFIGDLAVLPEHRGGTGRALLLECLWRYRRAGFHSVSLAVTLENERAFRLYEDVGFTVRYKFPVLARRAGRRSSFESRG